MTCNTLYLRRLCTEYRGNLYSDIAHPLGMSVANNPGHLNDEAGEQSQMRWLEFRYIQKIWESVLTFLDLWSYM